VLPELPDDASLLELVHLDYSREQLEVVARVGSELLERRGVLGEAAASVADSGAQEMGPEPVVESDPARD
jgi:hypothetical protein